LLAEYRMILEAMFNNPAPRRLYLAAAKRMLEAGVDAASEIGV